MRRFWPIGVFALFFSLEFAFATHQSNRLWFWTDEGFSLLQLTAYLSVGDYLLGNSGEGNVAPLFFLSAKLLLWLEPFWSRITSDPVWVSRFSAIVPASACMGLFCVDSFSTFRSWLGFAWCTILFVVLSSVVAFVDYSWQARPYGLWLFLSYLFWREGILREGENRRRMMIFSLLLCLTTPFALLEVGSYALVAAAKLRARHGGSLPISALRNRWLPLLPAMLVGFGYSLQVPPYAFQWPGAGGMMLLIQAHAKYWLYGIVLACLALLARRRATEEAVTILSILLVQAMMVGVLVGRLYLSRGAGFEIGNRYFLFLLPQSLVLVGYVARSVNNKLPPATRLAFGTTLLLIFGLIAWVRSPGLGDLERINEAALTSLRASLISSRASAEGRCVCHLADQEANSIEAWGISIFAIREWNLRKSDCSNPVSLLVEVPSPRSPRFVEGTEEKGTARLRCNLYI